MANQRVNLNIIDYFEQVLGIKTLSPIQKITLKVIVGEHLDTKTPIEITHPYQRTEGPYARTEPFANEVEMFLWFSGKDEYIPGKRFTDASLTMGRRSGKSNDIGAGLASYFATQRDYSKKLGRSPFATIPIISPTKEQANEVYNATKNFFLRSPYLFSEFLGGEMTRFQEEYDEANIRDGSLANAQIKMTCSTVIKTLTADVSRVRGFACPMAILDEACWFGTDNNDTKNTDKGIYEALQPATAQFGDDAFLLKISSPNGEAGLMYEDYLNRKDEDVLHLQVPTWWANPTISIDYLEKQKKKGIHYFSREYGALYVASENAYLDPALVERTLVRGMAEIEHNPKYRYVAAMDYATKEDYWTLAIGHKEYVTELDTKEKKEMIYCDFLTHWKGKQGAELDPSAIVEEICQHLKRYKVNYCFSDHYAYAALKAFFKRDGILLKEFKVSSQSKLKYMYSLQIAINSGTLKLASNKTAIKHLKDLREKRTSTGKLKVEHASNCHDDYADSIGLVVYQFDKTSPIYIGAHKVEDDEEIVSTKDRLGRHLAFPTSQEISEHVGNSGFFDNRAEVKAKKEEEDGGSEPDEGNDFWFSF